MRWSILVLLVACGGSDDDGGTNPLPPPSCDSAGGTATVAAPALVYTLADRYQEAWLASPAVAWRSSCHATSCCWSGIPTAPSPGAPRCPAGSGRHPSSPISCRADRG